ncbi:rhodanese-like domain-containing protein [Rhizobium panacihumi]|uniref:rhodanese-like domain-containing protein n=1 Tax=Rhizobium panacihumi TaxID=2008450 RepID=UPI003D7B3228
MQFLSPQAVKSWLSDGIEIAFLDVREHGQYGEGHPFLVVSTPFSRLEHDVARLVPRKTTRIVVLDNNDGVAERAATSLLQAGYSDLSVLEGGAEGWRKAGYTLFKGVNLPSKTFGELAEEAFATPHIAAVALKQRREAGEDIVVIDGRPLSEFRKMSIPGAVCCPNGELALRIGALAPDPKTTIVINCAGRTRSIIGAQILLSLGITNPVLALENGTQGWHLQDLGLEHGRSEQYPVNIEVSSQSIERASVLADEVGLFSATRTELEAWLAADDSSTFVIDVRTAEEVTQNGFEGAIHAPGGQLLQSTDQYVGVRGARIVLIDTDRVRAPVVGYWLHRLGWDVALVRPEELPKLALPEHLEELAEVSPQELSSALSDGNVELIDLRPSGEYRKGHIQGARWSIRPRLSQQAGKNVVLISDEPYIAALAARNLTGNSRRLSGRIADWQTAGLAIVSTLQDPPDDQRIDFLFFVHDRHDGNKAAAREYLKWETGLVAQLDADERAIFRLPAHN